MRVAVRLSKGDVILAVYEGKLLLNTIDKVKNFTTLMGEYKDVEIYVSTGRYIVDGKSIMGIFSLDLMRTLNFRMECEDEKIIRELVDVMAEYMVE